MSEEIIDIVASHDIGVFAGCPADAIKRVACSLSQIEDIGEGLPVTILVILSAMTISIIPIVAGTTVFGLASVTAGCSPRIGHDSDTTERVRPWRSTVGFASGSRNGHALRSVALNAVVDSWVRVSGAYSRDASALRNTHVPAVSFLR